MPEVILFRCDVSPHIGAGHLRRCLTLGNAAMEIGANVAWRVGMENFDIVRDWLGHFENVSWCRPNESLEGTLEWVNQWKEAALVLDHYELAAAMDQRNPCNWMRFDAAVLDSPTGARWIHNALPEVGVSCYATRARHPKVELLLGPSYALLRPEFAREAADAVFRENVGRILLTFGGGDDRGATGHVLKAMEGILPGTKRVVMCSSANPSLPRLREMAESDWNIELHVDVRNPAPLMAGTDMAICAGGTTLNELACLGVPALVMTIASNQKPSAKRWEAVGTCVQIGEFPGTESEQIAESVKTLAGDPVKRFAMYKAGKSLVDGNGARRTLEKLLQ